MTKANLVSGIGASAGQVIQVLSTIKTDTSTQSGTHTYTDIPSLSVSITPSSASNKILIIANVNASLGTNGYRFALRVLRDSTAIGGGTVVGSRQSAFSQRNNESFYGQYGSGFNHLDSPSTTSSVTYKIQWIIETPATGYINRSPNDGDTALPYDVRTASSITVMEVKG